MDFLPFDSQCEIIKYNEQKNTGIKNHCASFGSEQKTSKHKNKVIYWISLPIDLFSREL